MKFWPILGLLIVAPAYGQTLNVGAGASNLLNSTGITAQLWKPNSTTESSIGYGDGHIRFGLREHFLSHGLDWKIGDFDQRIAYPTDYNPYGYGYPSRGVTVEHQTKTDDLRVFGGFVSNTFSTPFLFSNKTEKPEAILTYSHKLNSKLTLQSTETISSRWSAVQSVEYSPLNGLLLAASGGIGAGAPYYAASLDYRNRWMILRSSYASANKFGRAVTPKNILITENSGLNAHGELFRHNWRLIASHEGLISLLGPVKLDSVGIAGRVGRFDMDAEDFVGHSAGRVTKGITAGAGASLWNGDVALRSDWYKSDFGYVVSSSATERFGLRWNVSQYLTKTQGKTPNLSVGGGYQSRYFSVQTGLQMQFYPQARANQNPFQKNIFVSITVRLPHLSTMNVQADITPDGSVQTTVYGNTFFYGEGATSYGSMSGKNVVKIVAHDGMGKVIDGVVVQVGKSICVTDAQGQCELHFKKGKKLNIAILPDDFVGSAAIFDYEYDVPPEVKPEIEAKAQTVPITLRRK